MKRYSKRGLEALKLLATRSENIDEVAAEMHISRSTAEKNLQKIKKQLNAKTLVQAVHIATKSGLIITILYVSCFNAGDDDGVRLERRRVSQRRTEQYEFLNEPAII